MGFLFCPRLRHYQRASDSSDVVLAQVGAHDGYGRREAISSSIDDQTRNERLSISSGLSSKLRRRFSRDGRDLYKQPKKPDRGPKVPFLHSKPRSPAIHGPPPASRDIGGSLMSDRGYDSDAQYIATPRHPIHTNDHSASRPRDGPPMSPRRPPPSPREPGIEARQQMSSLTVDTRVMGYEQRTHHGGSGESYRSREYEHRVARLARESPSSFKNVDLGSPRGTPSSPCPSVNKAWAQERPAPSPSPVPMRMQEMHRAHVPPVPNRPPMSRGGSAEDSASQRSGHGHDTGISVYSNPHPLQQHGFTTSADSFSGYPPQINVRKRHQRPRKEMVTHGEQSVHLGEMNIHSVLASSGSTSRLQSQGHPADENKSSSNIGIWSTNRHQIPTNELTMPIWDAPVGKPPVPGSMQNPRSPYSPKSSLSSIGNDIEQNVPCFSGNSSGDKSPKRPYLPSEHASAAAAAAEEANALRSKFTERFGSDSTVGPVGADPQEDARKISIGWMSEGRRIGYGYTLVPPDHSSEGQGRMHCEPASPPALPEACGSAQTSPKGSLGGSASKNPKGRSHLAEKTSQATSKTSNSSFDISALLQKLNLPRWAGTNFGLSTGNVSDAGSCDSGGSSLLGILTNKKKTHGEAISNIEGENPWEFCSWVRPTQSLRGQQAPSQDTIGSYEHAEAQLVEKLTTLRRRKGAWATKRKVSEIARRLEKRADRAVANLATSTDRFPIVQRTATRVLKLRGSGKERSNEIQGGDPSPSAVQADGCRGPQIKPCERTSSVSSVEWDSLYEECLEECSILD